MPIFQPELETLARPELERLQRERLRERFAVELEALPELPFAVKSDLRDAYPFGLLRVPREDCIRVHASSGTRGKATLVAYTRGDVELWADCCARAIAAAGGGPGTVVHVAYGYGLFTGGLGLHYGAERLGCTVVPASGGPFRGRPRHAPGRGTPGPALAAPPAAKAGPGAHAPAAAGTARAGRRVPKRIGHDPRCPVNAALRPLPSRPGAGSKASSRMTKTIAADSDVFLSRTRSIQIKSPDKWRGPLRRSALRDAKD